ncbi:mucin-13-like, partial [Anopheles stephensi]
TTSSSTGPTDPTTVSTSSEATTTTSSSTGPTEPTTVSTS